MAKTVTEGRKRNDYIQLQESKALQRKTVLPGSVAEIRLPKRREGMADFVNPSGMGLPVTLANQESTVSAPLIE